MSSPHHSASPLVERFPVHQDALFAQIYAGREAPTGRQFQLPDHSPQGLGQWVRFSNGTFIEGADYLIGAHGAVFLSVSAALQVAERWAPWDLAQGVYGWLWSSHPEHCLVLGWARP